MEFFAPEVCPLPFFSFDSLHFYFFVNKLMVKFITKGVEELSPEHPCSFEALVHHNRQTDSESGVCLKTIIEENVPLYQTFKSMPTVHLFLLGWVIQRHQFNLW